MSELVNVRIELVEERQSEASIELDLELVLKLLESNGMIRDREIRIRWYGHTVRGGYVDLYGKESSLEFNSKNRSTVSS